MSPLALVLQILVRIYQWTIRPLIGANCRFHPSCSDYAIEALRTHGALRGSALSAGRILRCNPWNAGGYDPVPPGGHDHETDCDLCDGRTNALTGRHQRSRSGAIGSMKGLSAR